MVTDATKKLREPVAYILLAFAGLFVLASLIRLFVGGAGFTSAAGGVQGTITPPGLTALVLIAALVGSVWLVSEAGERTPNARTIALVALSIAGLALLIGLVTAFAGFAETSTPGLKIVSFIYALGGLALYGAAVFYLLKTFQALPAPARMPKAGQFAGQGQYGGQYGGQPGGQYGQQGQYGGQPGGQYGQYGPGEPTAQYGAFGAGAAAGAAGGYAAAQGGEQQWPQEQGWNQGEQQAWSAGEAEQQRAQGSEQAAWSAGEGQGGEATQPWSSDGGQQQWNSGQDHGQQWPQQEQESQWGSGQEQGQQWPQEQGQGQQWPQQEWQRADQSQGSADQAQPQGAEQGWSQQQGWEQGEQQQTAWPTEEPSGEAQQGSGTPDETRVDNPPIAEPQKDEENPQGGQQNQAGQQNQGGQQGWWSQPS